MPVKTRREQVSLLLYTVIFLWLGLAALYFAEAVQDLRRIVILSLAATMGFVVSYLVLGKWQPKGDFLLFSLASMLSVAGLVMILRLSPGFAGRQFIWLLVGLAVFLLTAIGLRDYRKLEDYKYLYIFGGLLLLLATAVFGTEAGGARSWIDFRLFRFQPSELVKIFLVIFLAGFLEERKEILTAGTGSMMGLPIPSLEYIGPLLVMWGLSLVLLVFQKDLGAALIFFGTFLAMIFIATGRWSYVAIGSVLFALGAGFGYIIYHHVQVRVAVWLNPWADFDGKGYQIIQSLFAIGSGGFYGTGLGLGQPKLIPAVHTDFIFSAWSEEFGLLGALGLMVIYGLIIYRGYLTALRATTGFGSLLASGLTSLLAIQTLVIVGGVIKLFPLTGVTLPFVSYGGSSLVTSYMLLGILTSISARDGV